MKARSPEKFVDVCDKKVTDDDGSLSNCMMMKAKNTLMKERIWINRWARRSSRHRLTVARLLEDCSS